MQGALLSPFCLCQGRGGLGSVFIWASGNGGTNYDNCNCDGYANSIYTLSVGSVLASGRRPRYSEACSSTLTTTYSSSTRSELQIVSDPPGKAPGATARLSPPCTRGGSLYLSGILLLEGMEGPGEHSLQERLLGLPHSRQPCPLLLLHGARSPLSPPGDHRPAPPLHQQARGHLRLGPAGCRNGRPRSGGQVGAGVATGVSPGSAWYSPGPFGDKEKGFCSASGVVGVQS